MKTIAFMVLTFFAMGLTACAGESSNHAEQEVSPVISQARIRLPLPGQRIAAGYFDLESTQDDRLIGVTSPISGHIELHTHINEKGILRMRRLEGGVKIVPGKTVEFKPGGHHIMMFDTDVTDTTEDVSLTFDFEKSGKITVIADIMHHRDSSGPYGSDSHGSDSHGSDSRGSGRASGENQSQDKDEKTESHGSGH